MNNGDNVVGSLRYDLDIDDSNLNAKLDSSDKRVQDTGKNISSMGDKLKDGLNKTAAGIAVVGAGLTLVSKNALDFTVDQVKTSKALAREIGTTTEEASELTAAFGRMGVAGDSARQMFGIFSKQINAATQSTDENRLAQEKLKLQVEATKQNIKETTAEIKKNGDSSGELALKVKVLNNNLETQQNQLKQTSNSFEKLGISTKDASGKQKDFQALLFEVADKFKDMPDGIDKTTIAMDLFGRSGKDMIKVLNLGTSGIQELERRADELGLTLNAKTIANVDRYVESTKRLKESTDATKIAIGTATAPVLTDFNMKINELINSIIGTDGPLKTLTIDFIAFGGPVAAGTSALIAFGANIVTVIGGIKALGVTLSTFTAFGAWGLAAAAGIGLVTAALYELNKAFDKVSKGIDDLSKKQVKVGNTGISTSGTSGLGLVEQLRRAFGGFATGTSFAPGGWSWVGEKGPELMNIPRGSQVLPTDISQQVASGSSISIDLRGASFRDRSDVSYMVDLLGRNVELARQGLPPLRA